METIERVGFCHSCKNDVYLTEDGNSPWDDSLTCGDWDWVCYPCQFKLQDSGKWQEYKGIQLEAHNGSGKCNHKES